MKIWEDCYQEHANIDAGNVVISEIQLCAMNGRRGGQYYVVEDSLSLTCNQQPPSKPHLHLPITLDTAAPTTQAATPALAGVTAMDVDHYTPDQLDSMQGEPLQTGSTAIAQPLSSATQASQDTQQTRHAVAAVTDAGLLQDALGANSRNNRKQRSHYRGCQCVVT